MAEQAEKKPSFHKFEFKGLDGSPTTQVNVMDAEDNTLVEIRATKEGVRILGQAEPIRDRKELDAFAQGLSSAWTSYQGYLKKLRKTLTTNAAGH